MQLQRSGLLCALVALPGLLGAEAMRVAKVVRPRHEVYFLAVNGSRKEFAATVPPPIDYNPETKIIWVDKSPLPLSVEALIALTWITMVSILPLITLKETGKSVTNTQITLVAAMWTIMAAGALLFTQVVLFQSSHFESIRSLTLVECVYFMCQVLTTVGYGDITPAKPRGQVFVGLYVICCLLVVANVISQVFSRMATAEKSLFAKFVADDGGQDKAAKTAREWMRCGPPEIPWRSFWRSLSVYILCCFAGVLFYTLYPGEGKSYLQGVYMSVISLSTVGFGAVTPVTEGGKVFAAFWLLFGSTALVALIGSFTAIMAAVKEHEQYKPAQAYKYEQELLETSPERFGRAEFLKFGLLHAKLSTRADLERIEQAFYSLSPSADGTISKESLEKIFTR